MLLDAHRNLKIADFGVARVEAPNPKDMTGETGTLGYMAPEVLIIPNKIVFRFLSFYLSKTNYTNTFLEKDWWHILYRLL